MSFRGDSSRRYGHVPPARYPVANSQDQGGDHIPRRPSLNNGDGDSASGAATNRSHRGYSTGSVRAEEELFFGSPPPDSQAPTQLRHSGYGSGSPNTAVAGYQHQYQGQVAPISTQLPYNPQSFARSQSTSLPYHPQPSPRFSSPTSPSYAPSPSTAAAIAQSGYPTPPTYNPAAYANTGSALPQRNSTVSGFGGYGYGHASPAAPQTPFGQLPGRTYSTASSQQQQQQQQQQQLPAQSTYDLSMPPLPSPQYPPPPPSSSGASAASPRYDQQQQQYSPGYVGQFPTPYPVNGFGSGGPMSPPLAYPDAQTPYPTFTQIPVGPNYSPSEPHSFMRGAPLSGSGSFESPSPPVHSQPPSHGLQRHPTNAPLPSRPLEGLSEEEPRWTANGGGALDDTDAVQESLYQDIVSDLGVSVSAGGSAHRPQPVNGNLPGDSLEILRRFDSDTPTNDAGPESPGVGRYSSTASTLHSSGNGNGSGQRQQSAYDWEDEESDPEAVAGLLAMQEAALDDQRFSSLPSFSYVEQPALPPPPPQQQQQQRQQPQTLPEEQMSSTDDSDYGGMDLGLYGGGYAGNLQYGNDATLLPAPAPTTHGSHSSNNNRPLPDPRGSTGGRGSESYPPFSEASVDYGGTGGLLAPERHRLSFDEGDERVSLHSRRSGGSDESPSKDDYPDMFYHPGLSNRPLPAIPTPGSDSSSMLSAQAAATATTQTAWTSSSSGHRGHSLSADARQHLYPVDTSGAYYGTAAQHVERSVSMSSHSNTPQVQAPARSRTDAAEERRKALRQLTQQQQRELAAQQQQQQQQQQTPYDYDSSTAAGTGTGTPTSLAAYDMITLPTGRKRKFVPGKLTAADMKRCAEPWALSAVTAWVRDMAEGDPEVKRKTVEDGLVKLFCAKVPTMNVADAEVLSATVVDGMFAAGILVPDEEWVKFGQGTMSGVLWQLTGSGCYAPRLHEDESRAAPRLEGHGIPVRCYAHHCARTLKKANLERLAEDETETALTVGWAEFYGVGAEEMERKGRKEVERQNVLHEIVTGEEEFMGQLDVLRLLYRDQLRAWQPPIVSEGRLERFVEAVFGRVEAVQQINKEHLLAQLKYRQEEQGPWIVGFSDLFREWIRKARPVYVAYSAAYPHASYTIRKEAERNLLFRQFLDIVREHKRSRRLEWTTFVKAPITRLQRYGLLLETVRKNMVGDSEERSNLGKALDEIKAVTRECDDKVDEMTKKVALLELQSVLVLRPGFQSVLNLDHLGRELIMQGDLQRQGSKGVRWVDTHALLFDHYFILAKAVYAKDGRGKKYDVSKEPIPMPLLFLESINDDPVSKQKGLAAPLARTTAATGSGTQLSKVASAGSGGAGGGSGDRPSMEHAATGSSMGSMTAVTRLTGPTAAVGDAEGKIIYPFRIKHLGHEVYTLFAASQQDRDAWCSAIIEAKTRHARALHAQNAEPFRLRVLSDGAFAYDSASAVGRLPGVSIRGTPLDRALREMEKVYGPGRGPPPVCRAQVNCATAFEAGGKQVVAVGTDYGIYISEASNPRGWTRSVQASKVTQIAVLAEFSVCLVIADRSLVSYPLDVVSPVSSFPAPAHHDNPRRAPQRLAKDVAFFATARMKDRTLLFYKRKEGMHNTFKVLEPVFQRATEKKSRLFGSSRSRGGSSSGSTETFRDFDEFYLPAECFSLSLFQTYVAVSSAKGFELLTLDKKIPQSIPRDLGLPAIANIASRIRDQRPLGMFRLNDQEFLLTYEDCAVYVDKHGEVSRTLIMEYSGRLKKAKAATMFGQYLVLFNDDYVEVRNAENGRLRQIIAGRDVRCLDYGFRGPTAAGFGAAMPAAHDARGTVKICMSHPEIAGGQIVLEMLLNDGHHEEQSRGDKHI